MNVTEQLSRYHPKKIDLSLGRVIRLLKKLGDPQLKLPPVIHVAGTNGKGSTIAFMRAICEAAGLAVHTYTSPHLIKFNERIHISGQSVSNYYLLELIDECESANGNNAITFFEITTAIAFLAFSRTPADLVLLETGLGGRMDATNVIPHPAVTVLTPISLDHESFLGANIINIAAEKAAIMRNNTPCIVAAQSTKVADVINQSGKDIGAIISSQGRDWDYKITKDHFTVETQRRKSTYPLPNLRGNHQLQNATQAISCLDYAPTTKIPNTAIRKGLISVEWPGRLQQLRSGELFEVLPPKWEIWIDGGHNPGAGDIIADQANQWSDKPLFAIIGMTKSKNPREFLSSFSTFVIAVIAVKIPNEKSSFSAKSLCRLLQGSKPSAGSASSLSSAIIKLAKITAEPSRILICGSLYLMGHILSKNY
ncbi:MAG: folylpolyglutamate synthase/dihydrofolate synthase family protein [Pseudomonadota bacterium]|nr:folylpolyglutamate synthase/dihydrofolate synthase family protein [Pseudomonadota bacterium]